MLHEAANQYNTASIAAVVMEEGIAHVFQVSKNTSKLRSKIEKRISKKKSIGSQHDKQMTKFFEQIAQSLQQHFDSLIKADLIQAIVIGSPGFINEAFFKFLQEQSEKKNYAGLAKNFDKLILAHTSSGFKHSLQEILNNKSIQDKIKDMAVCGEQQHMNRFYEVMQEDETRVCYGPRSVDFAVENNAVEVLLVSDKLFRNKTITIRKKYVKMVEEAQKAGVEVAIFSSLNQAGESKITALTLPKLSMG